MKTIRALSLTLLVLAVLSACGPAFKTYNGPEVTQIIVYKEARRMILVHENLALKIYEFDLGFSPTGDKKVEGDGKTPEGHYVIDRKNPNSSYHLSLGISYPNEKDRAEARALGQSPGGDIFIHGTRGRPGTREGDWTWGCIAVTNDEIEDIYAMVQLGTPISIYP